jgi:beta-aspartyl-peptidase (threonine type)
MGSIIVHGGAGVFADADVEAAKAGAARAADAGYAVLARGGSALAAVEAAVRVLEDDPVFNAGYGAVLNERGDIETDACVMESSAADRAGRVGAVAAVPFFRHPVTLARLVMEEGRHAMIVGEGATLFAAERGLTPSSREEMIAPHRAKQHAGDTVGACAIDDRGHVAAATSTGGTSGKRVGRVGDAPLVGCGTYAEFGAGAASATGHGESIMRVVLAKDAIDQLRAGRAVGEVARGTIDALVRRTDGEAGVILVDASGAIAHYASTPRMPWAHVVAGVRAVGIENA